MIPTALTPELRALAWAVVLGVVQILAAAYAVAAQRQGGLTWAAGSRDTPQPPPTGVAARLVRARDNFAETFPFFAAAVLAAGMTGHTGGLSATGAAIYFWGRVIYLPLYAAGVPYLRSVVWGVATAGMLMVLAATLLG